jgi:hypothetical protein
MSAELKYRNQFNLVRRLDFGVDQAAFAL